jgi:nesprin-1
MENIFGQLEQIPEQWKAYEVKFREMSDWMDTVERSLDNVNKGMTSHEGFLHEKQIFQVTYF